MSAVGASGCVARNVPAVRSWREAPSNYRSSSIIWRFWSRRRWWLEGNADRECSIYANLRLKGGFDVRVRTSSKRLGGTAGMALVVGTLCMIGSAPAYGHNAAAKSAAMVSGEQKEHQEIAKFEADVSHLKDDFALLPPEVNSMLMYAGSASGSLQEAATAWKGLANELQDAAASYASLTSALTRGSQFGPSTSATAAAAAPYVAWMHSAAQQAEQAAAQARAAATAFEQSVNPEAPGGHG
jgi:PPE family